MGQMLTAKQVAEVKGCSYQYVKRIIKEGKLQAQEGYREGLEKKTLIIRHPVCECKFTFPDR